MRFSTFFAAVFLPPALALNGASAKEIETKSAVSAVTIYPDAASVTREAVVDLPDGESTIVFTGAPYATKSNWSARRARPKRRWSLTPWRRGSRRSKRRPATAR